MRPGHEIFPAPAPRGRPAALEQALEGVGLLWESR